MFRCVLSWILQAKATPSNPRDNLREALDLFFESASSEEIKQRVREEVFITQVEVAVG